MWLKAGSPNQMVMKRWSIVQIALDIIETMKQYNLAPKRIQVVYPKVTKEAEICY